MPGFEKVHATTRLLELVRRVTRNEIQRERPSYRYATVDSIDRFSGKCNVIFTGEDEAITVNLGSIQPVTVGQIVRVDGLRTDRFISDVIGHHWHGQASFDQDSAITGGGEFTWFQTGTTVARGGSHRLYADEHQDLTTFRASVATAPQGQAVKIDIKKNLTTSLFDDYISLPVGANEVKFIFDGEIDADEFLTCDVIQVGTSEPSRDLVVRVH